MIQLQEHEQLCKNDLPVEKSERYDNLQLIQWDKPMDNSAWGYYASFKIGAEWIDKQEALVVTAKRGMEKIDFLRMFMTCFCSDLAVESFSKIYSIDLEKPAIVAPALSSVVSPLIVFHFIGVVNRIKSLRKGYVLRQENLKKVKGHIKMLKNERINIAVKRYDRIYCEYADYSVDTPENRLLKKALVFSQRFVAKINRNNVVYSKVNQMVTKALSKFDYVSDDININSIGQIRSNKLYREYAEAMRLAKIILKHFDYSLSNVEATENRVTPFVLDMSLLYEHYVYGLLHEAYREKISYQYPGVTGLPDFLYKSKHFNAILDTKYIPKYEKGTLDKYVIRQLSGYSRDLTILSKLGYEEIDEDSPTPSVPCIIIYPKEDGDSDNPFKSNKLRDLCTWHLKKSRGFIKSASQFQLLADKREKSTLIIKINSIMAQMKLIPADNMKDKLWGKRGTPEREAMEAKLKEDVNAYIVGEAIRKARLAQNLTQEQLGERIGVQRAQISKLEKGTSVITLPTMSRVFQALGIATATLDLGIAGKIALW